MDIDEDATEDEQREVVVEELYESVDDFSLEEAEADDEEEDDSEEAEAVEEVDADEAEDRMDCMEGEGDCEPDSVVVGIEIISFLFASSISSDGIFKFLGADFIVLSSLFTLTEGVSCCKAEDFFSSEPFKSFPVVRVGASALKFGIDIGGMVRLANGTFGSS